MIETITDFSETHDEIVKLWNNVFGDENKYIDFFLNECPNKVCIAYKEKSEIVSMLFLIDSVINGLACKYLYAACTLPNFRSKGIMGSLIEYSKKYCQKLSCDTIVLVPAENSLYKYYESFGFRTAFQRDAIKLNNSKSDFVLNYSDNIDEISSIRCELVDSIKGFRFVEEANKYAVKEHFFNGGKVIVLNDNNEKTLVFLSFYNGQVIIKEFLSNIGLKSRFFQKYDVENIYIHLPIVYNIKANELLRSDCGMVYTTNESLLKAISKDLYFYCGLYLD